MEVISKFAKDTQMDYIVDSEKGCLSFPEQLWKLAR